MSLIAGYDIETTGLLHPDHRILEIYIGHWDLRTRKLVDEYETRIDPQRSIDPAALRVHKITPSMLFGKPIFSAVAPEIRKRLTGVVGRVAHNGNEFDFKFVNQELKRVELDPLPDDGNFDTMLDGRWAMPLGEIPNLQNLCFACGVPYDTEAAHAGKYDVHRMMDCFFKAYDWGFYKLPVAA